MSCDRDSRSSSVGRKVTDFFRRLVKSNKDDSVHACIPHESVSRAVDLYKQIETASDGIVKDMHSTKKGKRVKKRSKRIRSARKLMSSTDESETEDLATGSSSKATAQDDSGLLQRARSTDLESSPRKVRHDISSLKEQQMPSKSGSHVPDIIRSGRKDLGKYKDDTERPAPSTSSRGKDAADRNPVKGNDKANGKCCSKQHASSGYNAREVKMVTATELESDWEEEDVRKPSRGDPSDKVKTEDIRVKCPGSKNRRIRAQTCTVRDPTFVWRESDDGLETKPVGMVKKKKGKRKKKTQVEYDELYRPGTPKPPQVWSSDSDPLDGLEELLDDVVKMEDRYRERRHKAISSTQPSKRNRNDYRPASQMNVTHGRLKTDKDGFDSIDISDEHVGNMKPGRANHHKSSRSGNCTRYSNSLNDEASMLLAEIDRI